MGQDGQMQRHQLGTQQHINLQQQVQDFMSGTGFFEQPDIGRCANRTVTCEMYRARLKSGP